MGAGRRDCAVVIELYRYPAKGMPANTEDMLELRENFGIVGDHHADGGKRQISLLTVAEKMWMEQQEVKGFCFRKYKENILLDGIDLNKCREGDLLQMGDAVLEIAGCAKSCHRKLCALAKADKKCLLAGESMFASVKKSGVIEKGMKVSCLRER